MRFSQIIVAIGIGGLLPGTARAQFGQQQTGLFYDKDSSEGFVLLAPFRGIGTYLIRPDGEVAKKWTEPDGLGPGSSIYLTEEGTLLRGVRSEGRGGDGGRIREYNQDGTCIWEFRYDLQSSPAAPGQQHHDFEMLPNGNLLVAGKEGNEDTILEIDRNSGEQNEKWNEGVAEYPETCPSPCDGLFCNDDFDNTCEFVLDGASKKFKPVWKWSSAEHRGVGARKIDKATIPNVNFNHIDYLPDRDHILLSCNLCSEIFIIDHAPRKTSREAGDLLWRWGMPSNYGVGPPVTPRLGFPHGVHWIYNNDSYGWSGFNQDNVGDIILFNNQDPKLGEGRAGYSSLIQLTPPWDDQTKDYGIPQEGDPFGPADIKTRITTFEYKNKNKPYDIDSDFQGSAQLLPHGRILMAIGGANNNDSTDGAQGDIYELKLDEDGTAGAKAVSVWRYVNPYVPPEDCWGQNNGPKPEDIELLPKESVGVCEELTSFGFMCNFVFRAIKYAPNYQGIALLD